MLSRLSLSPICPFLPPCPSLSSFWASLEGMTISIYGRSLDSAIHTNPRWRHRGMSWSSVIIDCILVLTQLLPKGVLLLNLYLLLPLLTACTNGYDSSLVNGGNCRTRWMPLACPDVILQMQGCRSCQPGRAGSAIHAAGH